MSNDHKDEFFNLLAHEKKISELYHNNKKHQVEEPSAQLDSAIKAMAKQQLSDNPRLLTKDQTLNQQLPATKNKTQKAWQWPISLVASVGLLGVLMMTQRDFFIHPNIIVTGDRGILSDPVTQPLDFSVAEALPIEIEAKQSFQAMKMATSTQKPEVLLDKKVTELGQKRMTVSLTRQASEEQMLDKSVLEDDFTKITSMSLPDMSKLAELLKQQMAIQYLSEQEASASRVKMQQILFENLKKHQKSHTNFNITEKYLSVLTEQQRQQLESALADVVP
jgi:hypothetical protein